MSLSSSWASHLFVPLSCYKGKSTAREMKERPLLSQTRQIALKPLRFVVQVNRDVLLSPGQVLLLV